MALVAEANKCRGHNPVQTEVREEMPRLRTILWTLAQAVSDLNLMLSPFLPHSANAVDGHGRNANRANAAH